MEFNLQDQDIINLLTKLKNTASEYPEPMLVARRQSFLKQMTEVGLGIGAATGVKSALGKTNTSNKTAPFTSTLVEAALIAVIVVETSAMAYFYREKLANFFETITASSKTEQVTPLPVISTLAVQIVSPSPAVTSTMISPTSVTGPAILMLTPTGTPVAGNTLEANQPGSTPDPKGNNGNHYGQTPKPERTKTNNGNNGNSGSNGSNSNNGNNGNNDNSGNNNKDPKPTKDK